MKKEFGKISFFSLPYPGGIGPAFTGDQMWKTIRVIMSGAKIWTLSYLQTANNEGLAYGPSGRRPCLCEHTMHLQCSLFKTFVCSIPNAITHNNVVSRKKDFLCIIIY